MANLVGVIAKSNYAEIINVLETTSQGLAFFEWRLDFLSEIDFEKIAQFMQRATLPVILTLRHQNQGGHFAHSLEKWRATLMQLALLKPAYLDIDFEGNETFIAAFKKKYPEQNLILSHHDYEGPILDIAARWEAMRVAGATIIKLVGTARSSLEGLDQILFLKSISAQAMTVVHSMGEKGEITRILGHIMGNALTYIQVSSDEMVASGILDEEAAFRLYRLPYLNKKTKVYALLGSPVSQSRGRFYHNGYFKAKNINAVYINCELLPTECEYFFRIMQAFPFAGFSITMPLKSVILPYIDEIMPSAKNIGAINTLRLVDNQIQATNTDGEGVMQVFEKQGSLLGKTLCIFGAGGAAKAIMMAAYLRGFSRIIVIMREPSRLKDFLNNTRLICLDFSDLGANLGQIDFIINALPKEIDLSVYEAVLKTWIRPETTLMDINYFVKQPFLEKIARDLGAQYYVGECMFEAQAQLQLNFWLGHKKSKLSYT